jgi:hypothetical protein
MVEKQTPLRVLMARYLTLACAALGLLTLVVPDWIEALTGYDPDNHSGAVEALIVAGFFAAAVIAGGYAVLATRPAAATHRAD